MICCTEPFETDRLIIVASPSQRDLTAGEEIFLDYGYCGSQEDDEEEEDIEYRGSEAWIGTIPKARDFVIAANLTQTLWKELQGGSKQDKKEQFQKMYQRINFESELNNRVKSLIPTSYNQLLHVYQQIEEHSAEQVRRSISKYVGTTPRRPEWIKENGYCVENLVPGPSSLPHAGHGAIAQFGVKKGEMIVPAPLLQIGNRDILRTRGGVEGFSNAWQLLLNYCFGHEDTSILLCPYTNAILINHCSLRKRQCGEKGPNAIVQWQSGWDKGHIPFMKLTVPELTTTSSRGLSMEVVATRDIAPGEEVRRRFKMDEMKSSQTHCQID